MTDPAQQTKDAQLDQIREWIASAATRTYKASDKRRYAVLGYDGSEVVMTLSEAEDWITDGEGSYTLSDRWMTPKQYEKLPEFGGF